MNNSPFNQIAKLVTNSAGNVSGLSGYGLKRLTVEIANIYNVGARPSGADWLFSATRDLDAFTGYLQFEPTVFVDFGDTTSLSYGTEQEPYNTISDFNRWAVGNRAGAVVGLKRGMRGYTDSAGATITDAGLNIQCYGTAASPVMFVPYGDPSQPMPIIDGAAVTGSGTYVWALSVGSIWRVAVAEDTDVFENGVRCLKKTWSTNAATTLTAAGMATYNGGYLYYWPRTTANPNDGTLKINITQWPIQVQAPNVAAPNFVKFIGIDVRHGRGNCARIAPNATNGSIANGYGHVDFLFCRMGKNGYDSASRSLVGSTTIISYNGVDATHRMGSSETISSRVIGCELYDSTHHAVEHSQSDNGLMEYNYVHDIFGAPFESYADASGHVMRNNRCENMTAVGRLDSSQGSGILMYNLTSSGYGVSPVYDTSHTKNLNNKAYNNWFKNVSWSLAEIHSGSAASPSKVYNNTFDIDHDFLYADGSNSSKPSGLTTKRASHPIDTGGAGPSCDNGSLVFSNNLLYYRYAPTARAISGWLNPAFVIFETPGAAAGIPIGDNNCYFNQTKFGTSNWTYGGTTQGNFTNYKAAMLSYSFDQAALSASGTRSDTGETYGNNGGATTIEALKYTEATGKPATGSPLIQGGANASANRLTDYIGQTVIAVATPAIGCYER